MAQTTTTTALAIKERFEGEVNEAVFYNSWLGFMMNNKRVFPVIPNPGDTDFRWKVHTAAQSVTYALTEGLAHPTSGNETYADCNVDYAYGWFVLELERIARDSLVSRHFDVVADAMELGKLGLTDYFSTMFLNDSALGLLAAIDDGNTYAGQTRGAISWFESAVDSTVGALSVTRLENLAETVRSAEHAARIGLHLADQGQITNYAQLYDKAGDTRSVVSDGGKGFDLGWDYQGLRFNNAPVVPVDDLTAGSFLSLDITAAGGLKVIDRRPLTVREIAPSGDNVRLEVTRGLGFAVKNPIKHSKHENLTA